MRAAACIPALCLSLAMPAALAGVSPDEAAKLGRDLTPMGSLRAGNADGSVPEWTGAANFDGVEVDYAGKLPQYKGKKITARNITRDLLVEAKADFDEFMATAKPEQRARLQKIIDGEPKDMRAALEALQKEVESSTGNEWPERIRNLLSQFRSQIDQFRGKLGNADQPLYTITQANMAQHAGKLTAGHQALLKAYPTYKMVVYPAVRTAFFPDAINEASIRNATRARLEGTENVIGAELGFPFPIPKNGAEVMWNHKLKFRGSAVRRFNDQAIVKPDGGYKITKLTEDVKFKYANLAQRPAAGNKIFAYYLARVLSPPRVAGQTYLVHEPFTGLRTAWIYNPDLARINRAPDVGYDNPSVGTDGEQFNDQVDIFNGALDRYDWKLVGKKEILIPYNSFLVNGPSFKYKDLIKPLHINQKNSRYELHRVWVVDATLKAGQRHAFKRRTFYLDEDSWSVAVVDCYDNRDQLWKVQEGHLFTAPFIPTVSALPELIYDLQSRRYFATTLTNESEIIDFNISFEDSHFDPANFKRMVRSK